MRETLKYLLSLHQQCLCYCMFMMEYISEHYNLLSVYYLKEIVNNAWYNKWHTHQIPLLPLPAVLIPVLLLYRGEQNGQF